MSVKALGSGWRSSSFMVWIDYCFGSKLMAEGFLDKALG